MHQAVANMTLTPCYLRLSAGASIRQIRWSPRARGNRDAKMTKKGCKTYQKLANMDAKLMNQNLPKRVTNLINYKVITGKKGIIVMGRKYPVGNYRKTSKV